MSKNIPILPELFLNLNDNFLNIIADVGLNSHVGYNCRAGVIKTPSPRWLELAYLVRIEDYDRFIDKYNKTITGIDRVVTTGMTYIVHHDVKLAIRLLEEEIKAIGELKYKNFLEFSHSPLYESFLLCEYVTANWFGTESVSYRNKQGTLISYTEWVEERYPEELKRDFVEDEFQFQTKPVVFETPLISTEEAVSVLENNQDQLTTLCKVMNHAAMEEFSVKIGTVLSIRETENNLTLMFTADEASDPTLVAAAISRMGKALMKYKETFYSKHPWLVKE